MAIKMASVLIALGLLGSRASALAFEAPIATAALIEQNSGGWIPEPTDAPVVGELVRRQTDNSQVVLAASDNTCGYFDGSSASPYGCSCTTCNCAFKPLLPTTILYNTSTSLSTYTLSNNADNITSTIISTVTTITQSATSTSTGVGSILCCDPVLGCPATPAPTACVDRGRYEYNTSCTGNCPNDPMTLKCTTGIDLFCNQVTFTSPDVAAWFCNYLSTYDPRPAQTVMGIITTEAKFAPTPTSSSSVQPGSSTKSNATSSATAAATSAKKVNGAVIGGAVGGVVGAFLIIGALFLFFRGRGKKEEVTKVDENVTPEN